MENIVTIVPVHDNLSESVIGLILPIQQIEFNVPVTLADQPDLMVIDKAYHNPGGGFWGAFMNGELVGTIGLIYIGHSAGAIRKMFVKKEFRGKTYGIAQKLLETLIAYSIEKDISDLFLGTVPVLKSAIRFYERNKFLQVKMSDLPTYFPRMQADSVFYHLRLKG
ncbi:MAG: GNAT family N-acetyltransferase [Chitinophagaceae bacterium]|nr:MAG: GNAT family N-acetyltransferase [Chitinophagaceae bacterium]